MAKKSFPERGVGSNQYADKPPRTPSEEEKAEQQKRSTSAAQSLQEFVSEEIVFEEHPSVEGADEGTVVAFLRPSHDRRDSRSDDGISSGGLNNESKYERMLRHPANYYLGTTVTELSSRESSAEWESVYSHEVVSDDSSGDLLQRLWSPTGRIVIGYETDEESGDFSFVVSLSGVSPPEVLLEHYGIEEPTAFIFGENDRVRVGVDGDVEDIDPEEELPDIPAVPFVFLPEKAKERIRDLANFHVQMGPIWEAHYREKFDTWDVLVKYGDGFKWEVWPPERQEKIYAKKISVFKD